MKREMSTGAKGGSLVIGVALSYISVRNAFARNYSCRYDRLDMLKKLAKP
jgi:hypothetical protein